MTERPAGDTNSAIVLRFVEVGPSRGNLAASDALLHPEFRRHGPLPTSGPGIEERNGVITACRAAFHGLHVTVDDLVAEERK